MDLLLSNIKYCPEHQPIPLQAWLTTWIFTRWILDL